MNEIRRMVRFQMMAMTLQMRGRVWRIALSGMLVAVGVLVCIAPRTFAQTEGEIPLINREYSLKAVFIYNFATYTDWPDAKRPAEGEPLIIGVYPTDPFGNSLDKIAATKKIDGHAIVIRRITKAEDAKDCHILFVRRSVEREDRAEIIRMCRESTVMIIGETKGFAEEGGAVEFLIRDNKIRFIINMNVLKDDRLKISSKVLALAESVLE